MGFIFKNREQGSFSPPLPFLFFSLPQNEAGQVPPFSCHPNTMSEFMAPYSERPSLSLHGARLWTGWNITWFAGVTAAAAAASASAPCRSVKRTERDAVLVSTSLGSTGFSTPRAEKVPMKNKILFPPQKSSIYKIINLSPLAAVAHLQRISTHNKIISSR